ncbi:MAG: hypothetical protein ACFCGT_13900 [Sandaracinaceae bacterium]
MPSPRDTPPPIVDAVGALRRVYGRSGHRQALLAALFWSAWVWVPLVLAIADDEVMAAVTLLVGVPVAGLQLARLQALAMHRESGRRGKAPGFGPVVGAALGGVVVAGVLGGLYTVVVVLAVEVADEWGREEEVTLFLFLGLVLVFGLGHAMAFWGRLLARAAVPGGGGRYGDAFAYGMKRMLIPGPELGLCALGMVAWLLLWGLFDVLPLGGDLVRHIDHDLADVFGAMVAATLVTAQLAIALPVMLVDVFGIREPPEEDVESAYR